MVICASATTEKDSRATTIKEKKLHMRLQYQILKNLLFTLDYKHPADNNYAY